VFDMKYLKSHLIRVDLFSVNVASLSLKMNIRLPVKYLTVVTMFITLFRLYILILYIVRYDLQRKFT